MTIYDKEGTDKMLFEALARLDKSMPALSSPELPAPCERVMSMSDAWLSGRKVRLEDAEGKISAAMLGGVSSGGLRCVLPGRKNRRPAH